MTKVVKPPEQTCLTSPSHKVFLAGSIEQGTATNWQTQLIRDSWLSTVDVVVFNPRRDNWDASWEQSINNPEFKNQVDWELDRLALSDLALFYFDPTTKAPITLMELGLVIGAKKPAVVYCPAGYWRKGNVDIICHRAGIPVCENYESFLYEIKRALRLLEGDLPPATVAQW